MASPRSKSTTRFYASAMPSGVEEKVWIKQELQRLADAVFFQMDKDKKELQDGLDTLTARVNALEISQAGNSAALVAQLRVDVDNLTGLVNTNTKSISNLNSQMASTISTLNTTSSNLNTLTIRFNILTDQ